MVLRQIFIAALAILVCGPLLACVPPSGSDAAISSTRIDQVRLTAAILDEVNYHRCSASLASLSAASSGLTAAAAGHSAWMSSVRKMSHTGGRSTGRTLSDRVQRSGLQARHAAENLAVLPRFRFGDATFRIDDRAECRFRAQDGSRIEPHSYRSLARRAVNLWMGSAGHRRNILSRDVSQMGAAAAVSPDGNCGRYWITQIFTG